MSNSEARVVLEPDTISEPIVGYVSGCMARCICRISRFNKIPKLAPLFVFTTLGFFNEAVYPTGKLRQLVCHGFPTYGSRPPVSDASGRWRLCLFRYVCTLSKLAAVLSPGTRVLLPHLSTGSDRYIYMYTDTTTIRDQRTVRKLTLNPLVFWEFFDRMVVSGCHVSRP